MSNFWNRVDAIKQQQSAAAIAKQDAAISKATDFWNRVDGIQKLEQQRNGAYHEFQNAIGHNPDVSAPIAMQPGNTPTEPPTFTSASSSGAPRSSSGSASAAVSGSVSPAVFEYLNADLAKYYGMGKSSAYQEALENTSYQRAMKDMKAAGLNPAVMFGSGRANGAGSNVYPSSGGSGGSYSRRSGGSSGNGKLFSSSMYGALAAIGGLVGIAATGRPDGFWIGSQVSQGAMNLMNAFNKK